MKKGIISTVIGLFILVITLGSMNVVAAVNGTEVKGVISVNTVWEKAKGPYLITDNLLIDTNTLLTIEAGTEIIFEGNYYIKVLGNLQINGTSNNKVSFSSSERWNSITINSNDNIINYCIFSNANKALLLDWQTRNNTIKGCDFLNNNYAIELGYSNSNSISNCNFDNNTTAIKNSTSDRNIISGCIFNENTNGIVTNSYYYTNTNNVSGKCRNNTYTNNEFSKNKVVALDLSAEVNYKVLKSQLYENGIGLKVNNGNNSQYGWYAQVNNCNIWNNDTNVQANGSYKDTYDFTNNYWGTEKGVEISSKIYDFYDDFNLGKVIYEPYLTVPYGSNLVNSNHSSGVYDNEILVELSVANGGDIYYTLDGTDPILNGVKYNSPITVSQDLIISCVSYDISGTVIPIDINEGYKVRIFGVTESNEKIYISKTVGEDFKFTIKVPSSILEYTLSVAYKPGAYCGYVSDGVSDYSGRYHSFENICDYSDIKLKYEPFSPNLPIDMNAYEKTGRVELKNISDDILRNFTLYCAHYREDRLIYLSSIVIDNLSPYSDDYKSYRFEYPTEFYKTDEVRFFVWNNNLKPLSNFIAKMVNEPYYPEDMEFTDVDLESKYYTSIKNMYLSGVTLAYEDGTFQPENYVMRNEASAMLCRLLGYWCNTYKFSCDDVPRENWESSYVGICVNEKIFKLEENKFRPYENITVAETYKAIENILERQNYQYKTRDLFMNINFENLDRDITRAEFAQMLYNYKNCIND